MRRVLFIFVSVLVVLTGCSNVYAEDGFYVIPVMKGKFAPVPKTGQTASLGPRDDGALEKGVAWPTPRFTDNGNGTVTDNLTGLIWTRNAKALGMKTWSAALDAANNLKSGDAGLADGSQAGDWRLPDVRELQSLIDYGRSHPALPAGHPFTNVGSNPFWSSSTYTYDITYAWRVYFADGSVDNEDKRTNYYVWCVRGAR